jgi:hypothetical protein
LLHCHAVPTLLGNPPIYESLREHGLRRGM